MVFMAGGADGVGRGQWWWICDHAVMGMALINLISWGWFVGHLQLLGILGSYRLRFLFFFLFLSFFFFLFLNF